MEQYLNIQFSICGADGSLDWHNAPAELGHPGKEIHIWYIAMDEMTAQRIEDLRSVLGEDEIVRVEQYRFDVHRRRFIACRGMLRTILASYLTSTAGGIEFEYGQWGKPRLAGAAGSNRLEFNVAHSEGLGLIAITSGAPVGIDVETANDRMDIEQIAREFFSASEIASILAASGDCRRELFLRYWTRKEAVLKATGIGLAGLDTSRRLREMEELSRRCEVRELRPIPGGVAAVAIGQAV
jgi:4'-phosphopantetheinyl transferase